MCKTAPYNMTYRLGKLPIQLMLGELPFKDQFFSWWTPCSLLWPDTNNSQVTLPLGNELQSGREGSKAQSLVLNSSILVSSSDNRLQ